MNILQLIYSIQYFSGMLCFVYYVLPYRQIKYPVDFDDELKTRKRQIR